MSFSVTRLLLIISAPFGLGTSVSSCLKYYKWLPPHLPLSFLCSQPNSIQSALNWNLSYSVAVVSWMSKACAVGSRFLWLWFQGHSWWYEPLAWLYNADFNVWMDMSHSLAALKCGQTPFFRTMFVKLSPNSCIEHRFAKVKWVKNTLYSGSFFFFFLSHICWKWIYLVMYRSSVHIRPRLSVFNMILFALTFCYL